MSHRCYITTNDNPFDPSEELIDWLMFDIEKGYDSCGLLETFVNIKDDMTQNEINEEVERAIDKIVAIDFTNTYKKITKQLKDEQDPDEDTGDTD